MGGDARDLGPEGVVAKNPRLVVDQRPPEPPFAITVMFPAVGANVAT